ncbi:MAG: rhodanese-like domain-containing protein [Candidatus Melainabacteria bacterium]|nr:rhodanese-like domain-containing protein [Candidatus Melainabacteria bacterium]
MEHSPGFVKLVEGILDQVSEVSAQDVHASLKNPDFVLIDVREDNEWLKDHLPGAKHMGRGIIERDIEKEIPDKEQKIVLYCGGGYRSALSAVNLQKMGYTRVLSMAGGIRGWRELNYEVSTES